MSILDDLAPSKPYDRTAAALSQLSGEEREGVIDAILHHKEKRISLGYIARALTNNTTENVDEKSVYAYKVKLMKKGQP